MTRRAGLKRAFSCLTAYGATRHMAAMGLHPPAAYTHAVTRLRDMSIAPPGRARPTSKDPVWSTEDGQSRAHAAWCPPGFEATRAVDDDMAEFFQRARTLAHPFAPVAEHLPADLECAIDKVCELGPDIAAWRLSRLQEFEEISESLRHYSGQISRRAPPHGHW